MGAAKNHSGKFIAWFLIISSVVAGAVLSVRESYPLLRADTDKAHLGKDVVVKLKEIEPYDPMALPVPGHQILSKEEKDGVTTLKTLLDGPVKKKELWRLAVELKSQNKGSAKLLIDNYYIIGTGERKLYAITNWSPVLEMKIFGKLVPDEKAFTKAAPAKSKDMSFKEVVLAHHGSPPKPSRWTGHYSEIKTFLKLTAHDPRSVKIQSNSSPLYSKNGWAVECSYRAKNRLGALVLSRSWFLFRHGKVVDAVEEEPETFDLSYLGFD